MTEGEFLKKHDHGLELLLLVVAFEVNYQLHQVLTERIGPPDVLKALEGLDSEAARRAWYRANLWAWTLWEATADASEIPSYGCDAHVLLAFEEFLCNAMVDRLERLGKQAEAH